MGVLNIQENLRHRRNGESEQTLEQELWVLYYCFDCSILARAGKNCGKKPVKF